MRKLLFAAALLAGCSLDPPLKTGPTVFLQPVPSIQAGPTATLKLAGYPVNPGLHLDRYAVERLDNAGKVVAPPTSGSLASPVDLPPGAAEVPVSVEVGTSPGDMINCRVTLYGATLDGQHVEIVTNVPIRGGSPSEH